MNTDQTNDNQAQNEQSNNPQPDKPENDPTSFASTVQALNQLMSEVKPVEPNSEEAKLQETTILTPSGERIELNEELNKPNNVKKNNKE